MTGSGSSLRNNLNSEATVWTSSLGGRSSCSPGGRGGGGGGVMTRSQFALVNPTLVVLILQKLDSASLSRQPE